MKQFDFPKDRTYLVACTYGPDSMALLAMLLEAGYEKLVVCAVNYHKFDSANEEFASLGKYCAAKKVGFELLDTETLPEAEKHDGKSSFGEWARKTRYTFFRKMYDKYNADGLCLAHQQDDLLEAYLADKEKKSKRKYGFTPIATKLGMIVYRPLLNLTHEDLLDYVKENRVPFSVRSEAVEELFTRSPIRAEIARLNELERGELLEEMEAVNEGEIHISNAMRNAIDEGEELGIRELIALSPEEFKATLMHFVSHTNEDIDLTNDDIAAIREFMLSPQPNDSYRLKGETHLIKQYDIIWMGNSFDQVPYTYVLEKPGVMDNENFYLDFSMGAEDRGIHNEDYPLTIRTALPHDTYVVHGFLQYVLENFSAWRMPLKWRYVWPVFVNKEGKIIYVPRYRADFAEYHASIFRLREPKPGKTGE